MVIQPDTLWSSTKCWQVIHKCKFDHLLHILSTYSFVEAHLSNHMQHAQSRFPSLPGEWLGYYSQDWPECSGNHGCSSPGSQPMREKHRYSKPPMRWELRATTHVSGYSNLCKRPNVLWARGTPLKLKQSDAIYEITRVRGQSALRRSRIMRGELERRGTSSNVLSALKSFTAQRCENSTTVGQKAEIGRKYISKGFTVRCRSRSALKISHLWSITACFILRSLSENSKWCSKPFHHCGTNHMLLFLLLFYISSSFCSGPTDKSRSESIFFYMPDEGFHLDLVRSVIYEFSQAAADGLLSCCHTETCQPCLGFHLRSTNTATQVYSKISMFAHVLALPQKQTVSLLSVCVCMLGLGRWKLVTVDCVWHSLWTGESDEKKILDANGHDYSILFSYVELICSTVQYNNPSCLDWTTSNKNKTLLGDIWRSSNERRQKTPHGGAQTHRQTFTRCVGVLIIKTLNFQHCRMSNRG